MLELKRAYGTGKEEEGISHRRVLGADYELLGDVKLLALELMAMFGELEAFMNENGEFTDRDLVLELYFKVRDFLNIHDRLDDHYRIYARLLEDGSFMVKLMCMDPSECLRRCLDQSESTVFFSATLLPVQYYKELLSGDPQEYAVYAKSPFSPENRLVLAASDVSSRYSRRGRSQYERIADYLASHYPGTEGQLYGIFPVLSVSGTDRGCTAGTGKDPFPWGLTAFASQTG